ncbi:helix-turn-helix transcriptional regulator [Pendulispora albinea]|uniref:Helix-turn-helix transcriptional regulator n=2 Tax=Pendulispora albinea TaxID=2741071 RepID=A0ABZ2M152_9BACT
MSGEESSVGALLRAWRTARGKSQLTLALEAGISSRHLSFVETGRSSPSREMVLTLAETLEVPLRERNALLTAAGYAAIYRETPLDAPAMADVRDALEHILRASQPNPTLVVNRRYDILMTNEAARRLVGFFAPSWRGSPNVARMLLSHDGLRPALRNWNEVTTHVVHRTRSELAASPSRDAADEALLQELVAAEPELRRAAGAPTRPPSVLVPMTMQRGEVVVDLFTTITTLGTPLDITLQELRIETLFPADARAREALSAILAGS